MSFTATYLHKERPLFRVRQGLVESIWKMAEGAVMNDKQKETKGKLEPLLTL